MERSYTAERVLRALEVVVLCPSSAPVIADAIGVHARTARRLLRTLAAEGYVERRGGSGRAAHHHVATVRLLALAAQLAPRLPLVQHGRRAVRELERATDLAAYLVVPCYRDVLVIACSGERGLRAWATLPACADAAGRVLLAHRTPWRHSLAASTPAPALSDAEAAQIVKRGRVLVTGTDERAGTLAVPVPAQDAPIAALGLRGPSSELTDGEHALTALLTGAAERVAAATTQTP